MPPHTPPSTPAPNPPYPIPLHSNPPHLSPHADIGGVGDFGPVDTERMAKQRDERDMPARVP